MIALLVSLFCYVDIVLRCKDIRIEKQAALGRLLLYLELVMGFELTGMKALTDKMESIREQVRTDGVRKAVRAGANIIKDAMVERTPVLIEKQAGSDSLEPGEVKANIRVRMTMEDGDPVALVGPKGKGGAIAKTAHLVEYGHRMVTGGKSKMDMAGNFIGGGKVHEVDVPAHPFLRPAFETSAAAAMEAIEAELGEALKEAAE
jgi:HK97 gp10 family phage protein